MKALRLAVVVASVLATPAPAQVAPTSLADGARVHIWPRGGRDFEATLARATADSIRIVKAGVTQSMALREIAKLEVFSSAPPSGPVYTTRFLAIGTIVGLGSGLLTIPGPSTDPGPCHQLSAGGNVAIFTATGALLGGALGLAMDLAIGLTPSAWEHWERVELPRVSIVPMSDGRAGLAFRASF